MKSLQNVDRWLGKHFERWSSSLSGGAHPKEALEIRREILSAVRDRIEPKGSGEYVFPYQEILAHVAASNAEQRDSFTASFVDEQSLQRDVQELLKEAGCPSENVAVVIEIAEEQAEEPLRLQFRRAEKGKKAPIAPTKRPAAWLYVTKGKADAQEFFIGKDTVYLGRLKEVNSKDGGLRRRNDLAFEDDENTVSREHAHISYESGKFRLFHDTGEHGTRLFREGRSVEVPASGGRGTQLKSGDEIHLGEARVRFETS